MRPFLLPLALLPLTALTACAPATYDVAISNTVPRPIQAQMLTVSPEGLIGEVGPMLTLGPGDKGHMQPIALDANRPVIVSIRCPGTTTPGPLRQELHPGLNKVMVAQKPGGFDAPIFLQSLNP